MSKDYKPELPTTSEAADAMLKAADDVTYVAPPVKEAKAPTVGVDVDTLSKEAAKRGPIKMQIVAGTEKVLNVNNSNPAINSGVGVQVVRLKIDLDKGNA